MYISIMLGWINVGLWYEFCNKQNLPNIWTDSAESVSMIYMTVILNNAIKSKITSESWMKDDWNWWIRENK